LQRVLTPKKSSKGLREDEIITASLKRLPKPPAKRKNDYLRMEIIRIK
jgi:hypothetical protein